MKLAALILTTVLSFSSAFAGDHAPGHITGTGINLFERNHSFAGEISSVPVLGIFNEAEFVADVTIRRGESTLALKLADVGGKYTGQLTEERIGSDGKSTPVTTSVVFSKAKKTGDAQGELLLNIDGNDVIVNIAAESFSNNHFHKPTYSATLNGQTVEFTFTGEACFGYSANLTMMILGTMAHLAK